MFYPHVEKYLTAISRGKNPLKALACNYCNYSLNLKRWELKNNVLKSEDGDRQAKKNCTCQDGLHMCILYVFISILNGRIMQIVWE